MHRLPAWAFRMVAAVLAPNLQKLALALKAAKRRPKASPRPQDRQPGTGTNENGPQVETNYPANYWPEDGDHS
jgi:hypothetical protein